MVLLDDSEGVMQLWFCLSVLCIVEWLLNKISTVSTDHFMLFVIISYELEQNLG